MNISLKEVSLEDDERYCDLLIELANYSDVYARPVPNDFTRDHFEFFKKARVMMAMGENLPKNVVPTNTYWVMDDDTPIGYATLKHEATIDNKNGHFGLCLKKKYQNKGIGTIVTNMLSEIAYDDLGLKEVIYTSKDENIQSQRSLEKIGAVLVSIHDGYHFYTLNIEEKVNEIRGRKK